LGSFAVISATVTAIDWLELSAEGHRRAVFDAAGARWVQP
jgi:pyridoxamine 5'-phosphate oxidase